MQVGLIGLGVMGRNLALNFRDSDVSVQAWDPWEEARRWRADGISVADDVAGLAAGLTSPRTVLLLVKAGPPVDDLLHKLLPHLDAGDTVIDCGNSHYLDTERRASAVAAHGIRFAGLGVSGGAEGARHGPAMMAGCAGDAWPEIESLLVRVAARAGDTACLGRFGDGGAGHFVKMVHNGIEYGVMQGLAEICHALHFGAGAAHWAIDGYLGDASQSYLVEITREILRSADSEAGQPLLDVISDRAGQKGTGNWCVQAALEFGVAVPTIAEAVAARQLSSAATPRTERPAAGGMDPEAVALAGNAADAVAAISLAQGLALADAGGLANGWANSSTGVARAWRRGSILRMPLLDRMADGEEDALQEAILAGLGPLRRFTAAALLAGQPVAALASAVAWADARDLSILPTRMVQAQRDRFGDHGFERTDLPGTHHGPWNRTGA